MNKFKQEVIEIYKIKKELEERLNCMHKMLFTGTTIPYHAFPYVYSYLFETLARLTKISFWVNKNRFKMVLCKDRQTIILLKDIIREKILLTRIYHYIEILKIKQRKTKEEHNLDMNEVLEFLFLNLKNWDDSSLIDNNELLKIFLQENLNTKETNIHTLLEQKKEQILSLNQNKKER